MYSSSYISCHSGMPRFKFQGQVFVTHMSASRSLSGGVGHDRTQRTRLRSESRGTQRQGYATVARSAQITWEDNATLRRQLLSQAGTAGSDRVCAKTARSAEGSALGDSHAPRGVELSDAVSTCHVMVEDKG